MYHDPRLHRAAHVLPRFTVDDYRRMDAAVTRYLPSLRAHGASEKEAGWRLEVEARTAIGLQLFDLRPTEIVLVEQLVDAIMQDGPG